MAFVKLQVHHLRYESHQKICQVVELPEQLVDQKNYEMMYRLHFPHLHKIQFVHHFVHLWDQK